MAIFNNQLAGAAGQGVGGGAFRIDRSLRFDSSASSYLSRTPSSAGNRRIWTFSCWVKRCEFSNNTDIFSASTDSSNRTRIRWVSTNLEVQFEESGALRRLITSAKFRDTSAWYHIVVAVDTTQSTSADRVKIYVNNNQIEEFNSSQYPWVDHYTYVNGANSHAIGATSWGFGANPDMYLAETILIDGQALAPTDFGEYDSNNNWNPKDASGLTFGTNGFHLNFSDNTSTTTIAEDSSGENNDWTANNFSVASGAGNDSLIDTPMNYEASSGNNGGNYATLNPLNKSTGTLSNGNLDYSISNVGSCRGTMMVSSGKWYFEVKLTASGNPYVGIAGVGQTVSGGAGYIAPNAIAANNGGSIYYRYGGSTTYPGKTVSIGTGVIGVAFDVDNKKMWWSKNGTWYKFDASTANLTTTISQVEAGNFSTSFSNLEGNFFTVHLGNSTTNNTTYEFNAGQRPFAYTPPTGYLPLVTENLPDPTIADGSTAMDVALWDGNSGTQTISGLGFTPDLVWGKCRSDGSTSHHVYDQVRTAGEALFPNANNAETTYSNYLTGFTSDGFTLGSGSELNFSSRTFVGWCWDGGTSTAANTDGSITSNVRANQSAGFSIVTYTGASGNNSIGHGLNAEPELIIVKATSTNYNWRVYSKTTGADKYLTLNSASAATTDSGFWSSGVSSSVFGVRGNSDNGYNGQDFVAYCFSPVAGYSAVGSYTGTGTSDDSSPFVYTGFKSRWIMFKNADTSANWLIYDSARNTFNVTNLSIQADETNNETTVTNDDIDILSNGFKIRATRNDLNGSSNDILYMAFAENPFSLNGGLAR